MLVIRQIEDRDLDDVLVLAKKAGKGMTSLPPSEKTLAEKIQCSKDSFSRTESCVDDFFLLVMEDTEKSKVVGTAGVYARTGSRQAFYAYRAIPVTHYSHSLDKQVRSELLHLTNDYTDHSEVATLFLDPDYRGNGSWLAASRYLLMGQFKARFAKFVIAELRGIINDDGRSPVWDAIGQNFFQMSYEEADELCGTGSNQFITELMPKHPIYTCLLPESARVAIGKPNKDSKKAMSFLQEEGYDYEKVIDIFDGGPIMRAKIENIKSVKNIQQGTAAISHTPVNEKRTLFSNTVLSNFRVIYSSHQHEGDKVLLPEASFNALQLTDDANIGWIKPA